MEIFIIKMIGKYLEKVDKCVDSKHVLKDNGTILNIN